MNKKSSFNEDDFSSQEPFNSQLYNIRIHKKVETYCYGMYYTLQTWEEILP